MRALHADLTAAQQAPTREPHVAVTARNDIGVVRRLDFEQLDATVNAAGKNDAGVTANGAVHRVRISGGSVEYQRVTNPTVGPWNVWTSLAAGMGTNVALAAWGTRVIVIYHSGTGVRFRESTNSGVTFSADAALFTSPFTITDLAVAYRSAGGDLAVAWTTSGTVNAYLRLRNAGVLGAQLTWTHTAQTLNGIAIVRGLFWEMVLTGEEITTVAPTVWSLHYDDTAPAWSALWVQVQSEPAVAAFGAPSLTFGETWRANFVEAQLFGGGATRLHRAWVHPDAGFDAGPYTWRTPVPVNDSDLNGVALATDPTVFGGYVYESGRHVVRRADYTIVELDLTADLYELDLEEQQFATRGHIDLDNSAGTYTAPPPPISLGARIIIAPGYDTASGIRTSALADVWISAIEHRRTGGVAVVRLYVEGAWELMRRATQRTAIEHTADSYFTILRRLCARAGIEYVNSGGSARLAAVTPAFAIDAHTSAYTAARQAYEMLDDRAKPIAGGTLVNSSYASGEASAYTFGGAHPLNVVQLRSEPAPVAEAQAFGAAVFGDDLDYAQLHQGTGQIARVRDLTSVSGAAADATAAAHRRTRQLDADAGKLVAPPHVELELYDVVDFTDGLVAAAAVQRRVRAIRWRYDRTRAVYEQHISLGER